MDEHVRRHLLRTRLLSSALVTNRRRFTQTTIKYMSLKIIEVETMALIPLLSLSYSRYSVEITERNVPRRIWWIIAGSFVPSSHREKTISFYVSLNIV